MEKQNIPYFYKTLNHINTIRIVNNIFYECLCQSFGLRFEIWHIIAGVHTPA